ncbi:hypothetical protein ABT354_15250 [Streptomyces sp. NPDC000594]|uniref:terpene synthase family protein n=1 Tax=Streptomyces sp. NPDC000594 TaxID=3154261 RepID=UPI00332C7048
MRQTLPEIPRLDQPFPVLLHPETAAVHRETLAWSEATGLLGPEHTERLDRQRIGWLTGYTAPGATRAGLRLCADWSLVLYGVDDGYCDEGDFGARTTDMARMCGRLTRLLDDPHQTVPDAGRCATALGDVRLRVAESGTPAQLDRWCAAVRDYLAALVWEASHRATGEIPGLGDYLALRESGSAVHTVLNLLDLAGGYEVPAADWLDPSLVRLRRLIAHVVGWDNDLYSYAKELADTRAVNNLVTVLARHHDIPVAEAVTVLVGMHDRAIEGIRAECRALAAGEPHPDTLRYAKTILHWVSGNTAFSFESTRYQG